MRHNSAIRAIGLDGLDLIINRLRSLHPTLSLSLGALILLTASGARAYGLGEVQVRSYLGENLRLTVPLTGTSPDDANCVSVKPSSDEMPPPRNTSVAIIGQGQAVLLEITSTRPVSDPVIGLRVTLGCGAAVTRDFVILLDPRPLVAPAQEPAANPPLPSVPASSQAKGSLASAATGVSAHPAVPSRSLARAHRSAAVAPSNGLAQTLAPRHTKPAPVAAPERPPGRDRLVLMHDLDSPALSLDDHVTLGANSGDADEAQVRELREDRAKLRAFLEGKDPAIVPSEREVALQKQLSELARTLGSVRSQINEVRERNQQLEANKWPGLLSWALGAVALAGIVLALWLARQTRRLEKARASGAWWEQGAPEPVAPAGAAVRAVEARVPAASTADVRPLDQVPHTVPRIGVPAPTGIVVVEEEISAMPAVSTVRAAVDAAGLPHTQETSPATASAAEVPVETRKATRSDNFGKTTSIPFGVVSVIGSLDEQIDSRPPAVPVKLDLELDLPPASKAQEEAISEPPIGPHAPLPPLPGALAPQAVDSAADREGVLEGGRNPDHMLTLEEQAELLKRDPVDLREQLLRYALAVEQVDALAADHPKAIALLREHVLRDEQAPTLMWLLLLGLYKQINKRPVYEALGEHFARRFHRNMVPWDMTVESRAAQTGLASLPEFATRLREHFGTPAGLEMLRAAVCDRDQPDSVVFDMTLQRELMDMCKKYPNPA